MDALKSQRRSARSAGRVMAGRKCRDQRGPKGQIFHEIEQRRYEGQEGSWTVGFRPSLLECDCCKFLPPSFFGFIFVLFFGFIFILFFASFPPSLVLQFFFLSFLAFFLHSFIHSCFFFRSLFLQLLASLIFL